MQTKILRQKQKIKDLNMLIDELQNKSMVSSQTFAILKVSYSFIKYAMYGM